MYGDEIADKPAGRPALRIIGWIVFALFFLGSIASGIAEPTLAHASGQILAQTALLCTILYFTALRGASWWKVAAIFAPIFIVVTLATLVKTGAAMSDLNEDIAGLSEFSYDKDGNVVVPEGAEQRGPMVAAAAKLARANAALIARYDDELQSFGAYNMMQAGKLQANPAILKRCADFALLKNSVADYKAEQVELIENTLAEFAAMDLPETVKRDVLAEMRATAPKTHATNALFWEHNLAQIDAAQSACKTLAKRRWHARGDVFVFESEQDMAQYNRANERMIEIDAQRQQILDQHIARQDEQRKMLRKQTD